MKTFSRLMVFSAVLAGTLLSYKFIDASWSSAPSNPPSNNVAAPLNVGNVAQDKSAKIGATSFEIDNSGPMIRFDDSNNDGWWIFNNSDLLYFIHDINDDGSWSGESPWPLVLSNTYATFENQVRAVEYCDRAGNNCVAAGTAGPPGPQGPAGPAGPVGPGGPSVISNTAPTLQFDDTDDDGWWIRTNSDQMYFMHDVNDNGDWSGESPWPLLLTNNYAQFESKVRADEYCDRSGNNCFDSMDLPNCSNGQTFVKVSGNWQCRDVTLNVQNVTGSCGVQVPSCPSGTINVGTSWASSCGSDGDDRWTSHCISLNY